MNSTIGIDLGTTYSVVATTNMENGEAEVIRNDLDEVLTPSVVHFDPKGHVSVGEEAKAEQILSPDDVVLAIKRQMGTDFVVTFGDVDYTPEGISAIILRALAGSAVAALDIPLDQLAAVITVPAYFGIAEKEATAQAAEIAGLDLLALVPEPVAAAISYGVDSGDSGMVLVYDLGGGTFDTTILEVGPSGADAIITDGDDRLGGIDWDKRLSRLIHERLIVVADNPDLEDDEDVELQIASDTESVKKALSARDRVKRSFTLEGQRLEVEITRADFEERCDDLVARTVAVARRAIGNATDKRPGLKLKAIVLVGGSSKMPMISAALSDALGVPCKLSDPDLAVAKGAALHASTLSSLRSGTSRETPTSLSVRGTRAHGLRPATGLLPKALGVLIHDSNDPKGERKMVEHIVLANTPLPITDATATFATILRDQSRVRVEIYEQAGSLPSEEVVDNRRVLDGELVDLPSLKAGAPIEVKLSVAGDGRISCTAFEPKSRKQLLLESYVDGVVDGAAATAQREHVARLEIN